ncbi:MAG: P-loop NTPase [bacterium]
MSDQAQAIREIKSGLDSAPVQDAFSRNRRVIAITSGKGGVGKSNIAINLGISLTRFGHRVLIVDADVGLANLDLLLGLTPKYNLSHVISGKKTLDEVVISGPSGIRLLPASSSGRLSPDFTSEKRGELVKSLRSNDYADTVLIDTGGGITDNIIEFLLLADEVILVTTPEPTSIMDSYGIIKILAQEKENSFVNLLVNMAEDQADAQHVSSTMKMITKQLINITMSDLGWVGSDPHVPKAVRQQQPFVLLYPASRATRAVTRIAMKMSNCEVDLVTDRGISGLYRRIVSFLK